MEEVVCDSSDTALRSHDSLAAIALDLARDEVFFIDGHGRILYANRSACAALERSPEELLSSTVDVPFPALAADVWVQHWQEIKAVGHLRLEVIQRSARGTCTVWELSITFQLHDGNEYACAFGRNMDERLEYEHEITEAKHYLEEILDTMQAGVVVIDPQGVITFANCRMARMFGYLLDDLIGARYLDMVHPDQQRVSSEWLQRLVDGHIDHLHHERHYIRYDGRDFWGHLSCRRMEDLRGNLTAVVGVIAHVSEMKKERGELPPRDDGERRGESWRAEGAAGD